MEIRRVECTEHCNGGVCWGYWEGCWIFEESFYYSSWWPPKREHANIWDDDDDRKKKNNEIEK